MPIDMLRAAAYIVNGLFVLVGVFTLLSGEGALGAFIGLLLIASGALNAYTIGLLSRK